MRRIADWMRRHWLITLIGSLIFPLALTAYWALDRAPPFVQHSVDPIAPVHAGEEVIIAANVKRENSRGCSATVVRDLLDANGVIHTPFIEKALLSAELIKAQDVREPNKLRRAFPIPETLPSGDTEIHTHLAYRCAGNPLHTFWPIFVDLQWKFKVLPPAAKPIIMLPVPIGGIPKGTPSDPVSVTIAPAASTPSKGP